MLSLVSSQNRKWKNLKKEGKVEPKKGEKRLWRGGEREGRKEERMLSHNLLIARTPNWIKTFFSLEDDFVIG